MGWLQPAGPFDVVVTLVSADSSTGRVTFSSPVTVTSGVDTTFSDTTAGQPALWIPQGTPSLFIFDANLVVDGSPGDTYESLGGSVRVVPTPSAGSVVTT